MGFLGYSARPWLVLGLWLALSPFWIQRESLWIDEAVSAVVTLAPSIGGVWQEIARINATEMHLPAYHYYLWGVAQLFGNSEVALRAANLPWMGLGFTALILAIYRRSEPAAACWMSLFLVTNPFLFYYTNEVRPYSMQFGLASLAFAGMTKSLSLQDPARITWSWLMAVGAVLLSWTTIYGLAWWLMCLLAAAAFLPDFRKTRNGKLILAFLVIGGMSAALFHAWVISLGARASGVGITNLKTLAYASCEWVGAAGFLPGRSSLRAGAMPQAWSFLMAGILGGLVVSLGFAGMKSSLQAPNRSWWPWVWFLPGPGIFCSGLIRNFRVVGRHFTPVAPSFFWFLSLGPQPGPCGRWTRMAGVALLALWIWGDVRLATLPEHRKDDYRAAAHFIQQNRRAGEILWWAADDAGARFYGLGDFVRVANLGREDLSMAPRPDWIVLSKADCYDSQGALRGFIDRHKGSFEAGFPSFLIYRLPPASSP